MSVTQSRGGGQSMRKTQTSTWTELIDRVPLMNEDGSRDVLDPDAADALLSPLGVGQGQRQSFLNELLPDLGIGSVEDLGGEQLSEILQGILA